MTDDSESLGRIAYEAYCSRRSSPGAWPAPPAWGELTAGHRETWEHIASDVAVEAVRRLALAVRKSCACESCKDFIADLAGEPQP